MECPMGSQGTMGQWDVPKSQWTFYGKAGQLCTFKALVGISPSGATTFVWKVFAGCISDKELTKHSGLLDLLERGDSVMADHGFDIEEDLIIRGVRLNIPHF